MEIFPYRTNMAKRFVSGMKGIPNAVHDCTGRRSTASVVVLMGESGLQVILSPLTPKTLVKRMFANENHEKR